MFKRQDEDTLYFSTKSELKINGIIYRPSICYKVPPLAKKSLKDYEATGKVTIYTSPVRFVNGGLAPVPAGQTTAVPSVVRADEGITRSPRRKGK